MRRRTFITTLLGGVAAAVTDTRGALEALGEKCVVCGCPVGECRHTGLPKQRFSGWRPDLPDEVRTYDNDPRRIIMENMLRDFMNEDDARFLDWTDQIVGCAQASRRFTDIAPPPPPLPPADPIARLLRVEGDHLKAQEFELRGHTWVPHGEPVITGWTIDLQASDLVLMPPVRESVGVVVANTKGVTKTAFEL